MRWIVMVLALTSAAAGQAAERARARLDSFAHDLRAISASFEQDVTDANGTEGRPTRGTLALQAPRQFRWDVTSPYQQQIVADGMHVWIYDPDLEQVTVRNQGVEEANSPLTVLTDLGELDREYVTTEQGEKDGLVWLRLKSKAKEPDFEFADLGFDAAGLQRMVFKDSLGNRTAIRFSDWKRDPRFPKDTFAFTPPPGVDVIGDVKPGAEVHAVED
jgi:outer membrane lipoprotein carrier protein